MRRNKEQVTEEQFNRLITVVENLTSSVQFIIAAIQATNITVDQQDKEIANVQEELRAVRAELNLRGGA